MSAIGSLTVLPGTSLDRFPGAGAPPTGGGPGPRRRARTAERERRASVRGLGLVVVQGVSATWIFLLLGLSFWAAAPLLLGLQQRVVLTGSMEPKIMPGDVVLITPVTDPTGIDAPRIVSVLDPSLPSGSYVHRVVRHLADGRIVTKGDANASEDQAVEPARVNGEVRLVVPAIGLPKIWLAQGRYLPLGAAALGTWAAALGTISLARSVRAGPPDGSAPAASA